MGARWTACSRRQQGANSERTSRDGMDGRIRYIYDYCVIGGGIVGLATAMKLLEMRPGASLVLLEKERAARIASNRPQYGVIHSGIDLAPGKSQGGTMRAGRRGYQGILHRAQHSVRGLRQAAGRDRRDRSPKDGRAIERAKQNRIEVDRLDPTSLRRAGADTRSRRLVCPRDRNRRLPAGLRRDGPGDTVARRGDRVRGRRGGNGGTPSGVLVRAGGRTRRRGA